MKRIFVGIPASEQIKNLASGFARRHFNLSAFAPDFAKASEDLRPVRWIKPHNLHVTLVPPWQVSDDKILSTKEKLKVLRFEPFKINFNNIAPGPNSRQPNLIWVSGAAAPRILDLRIKIYKALGNPVDPRPFRLHMTLARSSRSGLLGKIKSLNQEVDWQMAVDKFVLYESHLQAGGSEYEIIEDFRFMI